MMDRTKFAVRSWALFVLLFMNVYGTDVKRLKRAEDVTVGTLNVTDAVDRVQDDDFISQIDQKDETLRLSCPMLFQCLEHLQNTTESLEVVKGERDMWFEVKTLFLNTITEKQRSIKICNENIKKYKNVSHIEDKLNLCDLHSKGLETQVRDKDMRLQTCSENLDECVTNGGGTCDTSSLERKLAQLETENELQKTIIADQEQIIMNQAKELEALNDDIIECRTNENDANSELSIFKSDLSTCQANITNFVTNIRTLNTNLTTSRINVTYALRSITVCTNDLNTCIANNTIATNEINTLKSQLNKVQSDFNEPKEIVDCSKCEIDLQSCYISSDTTNEAKKICDFNLNECQQNNIDVTNEFEILNTEFQSCKLNENNVEICKNSLTSCQDNSKEIVSTINICTSSLNSCINNATDTTKLYGTCSSNLEICSANASSTWASFTSLTSFSVNCSNYLKEVIDQCSNAVSGLTLDRSPSGRQYYFYNDDANTKSWYSANAYCHSKGMKLASIETSGEGGWLRAKSQYYLMSNGRSQDVSSLYWISLNNLDDINVWTWEGTGEVSTYFDWKAGNPEIIDTKRCVGIQWYNGNTWSNEKCETTARFICEVLEPCSFFL